MPTRSDENSLIHLISGRICEVIAEEMFRELGFYVVKLGQEHIVSPVVQLKDFVKKHGGNYAPIRQVDDEVKPFDYIRSMPDFLVIIDNHEPELLEVKFRKNAGLWPKDEDIFDVYPLNLLVINTEISEDYFIKKFNSDENNVLEELKTARFHIWFEDKNENIVCMPLKNWLEQKFKLENSGKIIIKYEKIANFWLKENNLQISD